jgi:hypothetical protein
MVEGVTRASVGVLLIGVSLTSASGCNVNRALQELAQARAVAADLLLQFTKASDAANRAVMADTDAQSVDFAREAGAAKQAVQTDVNTLKPLLEQLKFTDESHILQQFVDRFARYEAVDKKVLDLAVENTNLKAQRLSFGPAQAAADSFRQALEGITPAAARDDWHVRAVAASAIGSLRDIQVLQAPHIADPDDNAMTRLEQRMAASEPDARNALNTLAPLVNPGSRSKLSDASASLDRFVTVNKQIIGLSRRNTNVRSLALSLNEKPPLTAACEETLRTLNGALAKRGYQRGRWE